MSEESKIAGFPGTQAADHGLDNHGLTDLGDKYWNLNTAELYEQALKRGEAKLSKDGALLVNTGKHTARSANDKFVVKEPSTEGEIWWGTHNRPYKEEIFSDMADRMREFLKGKDVFVLDAYVGADEKYAMPIRVITTHAWLNLFARNMFIVERDTEKLKNHVPEFTMFYAPELEGNPEQDELNSETFILLNLKAHHAIIGGTLYGGEAKKTFFTIMNYLLPKRDVLSMHCSANIGPEGDSAIFFGLSGTGKTTLSADVNRGLIGDDEHGWSDDGIFNFEGGCYAKVIKLNEEAEPQIYKTTGMFGTILENVVFDDQTRVIDLDDDSLTENTRASYPLEFISNAVPSGKGDHPKNIFMLTCDVSGVLPPLSKLSAEQAMYHFISGYTSKVAGTEKGLGNEPKSTFSACFGAPFMVHHPYVYAKLLKERMLKHDVHCWLINTGWTGGPFGVGERISIKYTRALLHAVLDEKLQGVEYKKDEVFGFDVPTSCPDVPAEILNPRVTWADKDDYDRRYNHLAESFIENFKNYEDGVTPEVIAAGPKPK